MATPSSICIDDLLNENRIALAFSPLTQAPVQTPVTATRMTTWLGEFNPVQYHGIEIIGHNNLQPLKLALQQASLYLPAALSDARPGLIIFADGVGCDDISLACLQHASLAAVQTPFPLQTVLRKLAYSLAMRSSNRVYHGVMLSVCGEGVLLCGDSGVGKSGIALELVSRGHRLVADDAPLLHRPPEASRVFALAPPLLADMLEVRALGILNVCKLFGPKASQALMPVDLIVELVKEYQAAAEQRLQAFGKRTNILGVDIPRVPIPIGHTTNPALLVETIAKNHVLYKGGYDANASLIERQQQLINKQTI